MQWYGFACDTTNHRKSIGVPYHANHTASRCTAPRHTDHTFSIAAQVQQPEIKRCMLRACQHMRVRHSI
jgi:hypothetical protein